MASGEEKKSKANASGEGKSQKLMPAVVSACSPL
jgi:hypothetical protein